VAFEELLTGRDDWFSKDGPHHEVVVTSRIRLARNLTGYKFPHHASAHEQKAVVDQVRAVVAQVPTLAHLEFVALGDVSSLDRQFLMERQFLSAEHAASLGERAVLLDAKAGLSLMVNEEDHLRLQVFRPGLNLQEAFLAAKAIDAELEARLPYAKDSRLGYITACPTNLGPALRAGVMVHLPALMVNNRIGKILEGVGQAGLTARGFQGESTRIPTAFFQISNQASLGKRDQEIVEHVERVARQILEAENNAQTQLFQQEGFRAQDKVSRALGILKTARVLTLQEALDAFSGLRVGVQQRLVTGLTIPDLNRLVLLVQPAHLAKLARKELTPEEEAVERALWLRRSLKDVDCD